jgi:sec-independent protein translocase protein TatC
MTMSNGIPQDPDDFFAETRMSFGDHIEELRQHLWRAIYGFGIALFFSFFIGHLVVKIITAPVKAELDRFYNKRLRTLLTDASSNDRSKRANQATVFRQHLIPRNQLDALIKGRPTEEINKMPRPRIVTAEEMEERKKEPNLFTRFTNKIFGEDKEHDPTFNDAPGNFEDISEEDVDKKLVGVWMAIPNPLFFTGDLQMSQRHLLDIDNPSTLNVQEAFFVWFKVCIVCGIVLGSPWIFWQIWMFVAAGLYPSEKRLVHVYLPVSLGLFLAGVVICELFVIPKAIEALLWFNEWLGFKPDLRLNEWLSFAIFMPLVFGLSFQTPLVMLFLHRLGIMDADTFRNKRRIAWFAMAVFAAVVTPSVDALSMIFLWVPMSLLFELGILLIKLTPHEPSPVEDITEADELVEV